MISVIIPNYNHARFLSQRIQSVLSQLYIDLEVIILDDKSTDNSLEIINTFCNDPRIIRIIPGEVNSGSPFRQWLKGLSEARGEWIWIAESDDYCDADLAKTLLDVCHSSHCDIAYAKSLPVDETGNLVDTNYPYAPPGRYDGRDFISRFLLEGNYLLNASGVLIRKDLLQRVLLEDVQQYRLFGDWLTWIRACLQSDIYYTDAVKNYHRTHHKTVRAQSESDGSYAREFSQFRNAVTQLIEESPLTEKKQMLTRNKSLYGHKMGSMGCQLIRDGKFIASLSYLLRATILLNFNLYYLRSAAYWIVNRKKLHNG